MYLFHLWGYQFDYYLNCPSWAEVSKVIELAQARYRDYEFTVMVKHDNLEDGDCDENHMIMKGWYCR